ncbi:MAG: glycoside hydrolase family 2 TIM barrel-domain containing protein [Sphaerochaeta sp.]
MLNSSLIWSLITTTIEQKGYLFQALTLVCALKLCYTVARREEMYQEFPVNNGWYFQEGFSQDVLKEAADEKDLAPVCLPHSPFLYYSGYHLEGEHCLTVTYKRHFSLLKHDTQQVSLRFEGIANKADFYVDGILCGHAEGAYLPYTLKVGDKREFTLVVVADSSEDPSFPPYGGSMDYLSFSGIYREVFLILHEEAHFTFLGAESNDPGSVHLKGRAIASEGEPVSVVLLDGGNTLATAQTSIEDGKFSLSLTGLSLRPWSLDDPYLYTLDVSLGSVDHRMVSFGSRSAAFTKKGFFLNDKQVFLRGLNRHQDYPYLGYAAPASLQREDAVILKDLGVNLVRTSHYPQHPAFLDACDRLGLLVFEEIPGWQHIGNEAHWREACADNVIRMIERDYNHPSIILWGVRINESADDESLYRETNRRARDLDSNRCTAGVRNLKQSQFLEDVYTYNDFSYTGRGRALLKKKKVCSPQSPYLVTEFCGHMYPCKTFDPPRIRAEHAARHAKVLDQALGEKGLSGVIGWCMHDYFTHANFGSGDQICYHGVLDIFRSEKAAAQIYRTQKDSPYHLCLLGSCDGGDYPKAALPPLSVATNCEAVRLCYNNEEVGVFYPDRKHFPNLTHPPVVITDFIGKRLRGESYLNEREIPSLARLLGKVGRQGGVLKMGDLVRMGLFLKRHKKGYQDAVDLFNRYVGNWGSEGGTWSFEGLVGEKVVVAEHFTQGGSPELVLAAQRTTLHLDEPSCDMVSVMVQIQKTGQYLPLPYAQVPYHVTVQGKANLASPAHGTTIGGSGVIYVRANGVPGTAVLQVCSPLGDKCLQFTVK